MRAHELIILIRNEKVVGSIPTSSSKKEDTTRVVSSFFVLISKREICTSECGGARPHIFREMRKECNKVTELCLVAGYNTDKESNQRDALHAQYLKNGTEAASTSITGGNKRWEYLIF